jgi:integrase
LVTVLSNDTTKTQKNAVFREKERKLLYHRIEDYPCVKRFLDKRSRNGTNTPIIYHTSLTYIELFLDRKHGLTINDMISKLKRRQNEEEFNPYLVIRDFVEFLINDLHKGTSTIKNCMKAIKGLLRSEMISLDDRLVLECASVPKEYTDEGNEHALDKSTISKILSGAKIRRLRVYLFALASSGTRVNELSSIRWKDIDFDSTPTTIHLRPETTKTRNGRLTFLSEEATQELKHWHAFKEQSYAKIGNQLNESELVFLTHRHDVVESKKPSPEYITHQIELSFVALLKELGLDKIKDRNKNHNSNYSRHTITLHAFRKAYKSAISMTGFNDLAEYMIGHRSLSQTYFRVPPKEIAKIYREKLMPILTFCDTPALENKVRSLEEKTEIINEIRMQVISQAEKIEKLESEKDQTFADYMTDDYANQRIIEILEKKIDDLKRRLDEKEGK